MAVVDARGLHLRQVRPVRAAFLALYGNAQPIACAAAEVPAAMTLRAQRLELLLACGDECLEVAAGLNDLRGRVRLQCGLSMRFLARPSYTG
jgi:hypothetical protein